LGKLLFAPLPLGGVARLSPPLGSVDSVLHYPER
jgi:hypothetical protein